jgi:ABC-type glycerol-3-phosphate transport system substrate-binding protein
MRTCMFIKNIILFSGLLVVSGCSAKEYDDAPKEVEQSNASLKVCVETSERSYMDSALQQYMQDHPDVKVQVQEINMENHEKDKVSAELMAGNGADLYVNPEAVMSDLYKAQQSGAFEDLMPWFEKEDGFTQDNYIKGTFDLYEQSEACYIFPIRIQNTSLAVYKGIEKTLNIGEADWNTPTQIISNLEKYYEKYPDSAPFVPLYSYAPAPDDYGMRVWKGLEANKNVFKLPELRKALNLYKKQAYPNGKDMSRPSDYEMIERDLEKTYEQENNYMGLQIIGVANLEEYVRMGGEKEADIYPEKDMEGNNILSALYYNTAIASASKNKKNAYELMQYIIADDRELGANMTSDKRTNKDILKRIKEEYGKEEILLDGQIYPGLEEETFEMLDDVFTNGEIVPCDDMEVKYWEYMLPFLENKKDYDTCLSELFDYMEIYYSE